jgi:CTP:molybdopterin cytidylyltransferase MocA
MMPADVEQLVAIGVIILAAGSGKRLGHGPKAHVLLGEESFLSRVVRCCREARLGAIWVVGSAHDERIEPACAKLAVPLVVNRDPERGMASSVWLGLAAASDSHLHGVLVFPVDLPLVAPGTARAVARELRADESAWARPAFGGAHGHPIGISAPLVARLLAQPPAGSLRDALSSAAATAVDVPCDDPAILADIDLPSDLAAARTRGA